MAGKLPNEFVNDLAIKEQPQEIKATQIGFLAPLMPVTITITFDPSNINSIRLGGPQVVMFNKPYMHFLLSLAMESLHKLHFEQAMKDQGKAIQPANEQDLKIADQVAEVNKKNRISLGLDD